MNSAIENNMKRTLILLSALFIVSGCATNPKHLQEPTQLTCIEFKEPLSFTGHYGLFNVPWTTRLEKGPYWSEKVDEKGTFYRAPPGGLSIRGENGDAIPGQGTADGGFYIPNSSSEPVSIYRYFSTADAPVQVPPDSASCATTGYAKDPSTSKVSLVSFAVAGAIGGATGGLISRSVSGGNMSYGQAAGVGAAGGLIGGLVVASIINAEVGKIVPGMPIQNKQFMEKLRTTASTKVPMSQVQLPPQANDSQTPQSNTP